MGPLVVSGDELTRPNQSAMVGSKCPGTGCGSKTTACKCSGECKCSPCRKWAGRFVMLIQRQINERRVWYVVHRLWLKDDCVQVQWRVQVQSVL